MSTTAASGRGRQMALARWKGQRPRKLAAELVKRATELPPADRQELRQALEAAELGGAA